MSNKPELHEHPTAIALRARPPSPSPPPGLSRSELRAMALEAGADDAGAVPLDHPELVAERPHVLAAFPKARSLIALVARMHPDDVRSPARSVSNLEFHRAGEATDIVAQRLAVALSARGYPSINPAMAFPMEMERFPERAFIVSHKKVAVAAQLGRMGIHRSVIHPRFGSFILLGTVITSAEVEGAPPPSLSFDPCLGCKLCIAACPVGAIEPDGAFRFSACYDHNYREFMTGFGDLLEEVADSRDRRELRERVSIGETASMWQSLAYKPNYKAAYCIAVCPAGEDVLGGFLASRKQHLEDVVRPLTERVETVFAVEGSDAAEHVRRRFPHKRLRLVRSSLRPITARGFFRSVPLTFQRGPARGWSATFHFTITGEDPFTRTVRISDGTIAVEEGLVGTADVAIEADGATWIDVVTKRRSPVWAVVRRRLVVRGRRALLGRFARCFPR